MGQPFCLQDAVLFGVGAWRTGTGASARCDSESLVPRTPQGCSGAPQHKASSMLDDPRQSSETIFSVSLASLAVPFQRATNYRTHTLHTMILAVCFCKAVTRYCFEYTLRVLDIFHSCRWIPVRLGVTFLLSYHIIPTPIVDEKLTVRFDTSQHKVSECRKLLSLV